MLDTMAKSIVTTLFSDWTSQFGLPESIHSGRGASTQQPYRNKDIDEILDFVTFGPDEGDEATYIDDEDEERVGRLDINAVRRKIPTQQLESFGFMDVGCEMNNLEHTYFTTDEKKSVTSRIDVRMIKGSLRDAVKSFHLVEA
ncbi:unnamed protein product [Lepeophtheirus salmonis]|uniref:(salmon louse) hypothetical protein n=1 Tax=Lepeophtheirus salmonis TaxID=72036 RepID=A0A7R8HAZ1_LEPSM|nr:unnamed protein product [Lepeophtheirus salmonis]CAF2977276.1 unnamed protein product [Lepeophtheirus salmonis]